MPCTIQYFFRLSRTRISDHYFLKMKAADLPSWKDMPAVKGMPHGTAWGLFDTDGVPDEVGTLNLLTPEVVLEAKKEIETGKSVVLKYAQYCYATVEIRTDSVLHSWSLDRVHEPGFDRVKPAFEVFDWHKKSAWYSYDDQVVINTQSGSQWDGLRKSRSRNNFPISNRIRTFWTL
jgi:hypothetical protein